MGYKNWAFKSKHRSWADKIQLISPTILASIYKTNRAELQVLELGFYRALDGCLPFVATQALVSRIGDLLLCNHGVRLLVPNLSFLLF